MRDRAFRRAQWERIKKRVRNWYWPRYWKWLLDEATIARNATHHHTCWMCGHRRFWEGKTRQERTDDLDWEDYCNEERW